MKLLKFGMRLWITFSSVLAFLASWILFGHSAKPIDNSQSTSPQAIVTPLPTLAPLDPMPGAQQAQSPTFQLFPQSNRPRRSTTFVTGGS